MMTYLGADLVLGCALRTRPARWIRGTELMCRRGGGAREEFRQSFESKPSRQASLPSYVYLYIYI